jgi:hypothetical protein
MALHSSQAGNIRQVAAGKNPNSPFFLRSGQRDTEKIMIGSRGIAPRFRNRRLA